jgi:GT2 family glycosyltransferase
MNGPADRPDVSPACDLPRVTFVIPVRDDAHRLRRCLRSIRANDYPADRVEIVVADNGSRDGSGDVARSEGALVLNLPGLSVATLRNRAAEAATGDVLAFVDADHEIEKDWTASAAEALREPSIGGVGAPYLTPAGASWVQRAYGRFRVRSNGLHDVEWLATGNMAMRRGLFLRLGAFDTTLETCEDLDLCLRVRAAGHRIVSDERLRSVHLGDPATLRALFCGELWRGRDNVRVTLRGPLSLRALPSVLIPVFDVVLLTAGLAGLVLAPRTEGVRLTLACAAAILALVSLRCLRLTLNGRSRAARDVAANFLVAGVYDIARALALVVRVSHRTRRERAGE